MKTSLILAASLALVSAGSSFAAQAVTTAPSEVLSLQTIVPSKVVKPDRLPRTFTRTTIPVEFSLDAAGQPHDIRMPSVSDKRVKKTIAEAFAQWKFAPSTHQAGNTHVRFVLPLDVIPEV